MKPTVAHAINNYLGLSETFIYSYLTNIKRYKPIVLTTQITHLEQFPFRPIYDCSKINRYSWWWFRDRFGYYLYLNKKEYFEHILYFKYVLKKEKARLVHAHFGPQGVAMIPIKRRLKLPLITTFYGFDLTQLPRENMWNKAYQRLFKEGDLFLVEGNNMKQSLMEIGCPGEKIVIQHIGVNTEKINFKERSFPSDWKIVILCCGRFVEKKGLIYALQALKLLISKNPQIEFRIIGDGVLRNSIGSFIKENNLSPYVYLLGYQPHRVFVEELKKAHIYIQPSVTAQNGDSEGGAPTTLLEAQAAGVPVLSTYHADIPEIVVNGKSGFLVPERDARALAERLEYLIDHPEEWSTMGREGRRHVEMNYNICKETENLENIYDSLITK
ncbi:MAG TPA: glycosyltransferase [Candidatus Wunengus sp. YC65]|uniref:glycosyltransferase n=1 Tax=Candidatus Wunengus sp. YC65 TaxID=3367701 RepID=UPI004026444B